MAWYGVTRNHVVFQVDARTYIEMLGVYQKKKDTHLDFIWFLVTETSSVIEVVILYPEEIHNKWAFAKAIGEIWTRFYSSGSYPRSFEAHLADNRVVC